MKRNLLFALLVALPIALVAWIVWRGQQVAPEVRPASASAADSSAADASAAAPRGEDAALLGLLSGEPAGAKVDGQAVLYDEKTLFDYIDGAAPIFIERHFRKLAAAEMVTPEGGDLTCDIYDMQSPADATSIFEKERSPTATEVEGWPEAITGPRAFVFHHDHYYVKLTAFDAGAEALLPDLAAVLRERMAR